MSSANRPQSPIVKLNKRKAPELILLDKKIHRIRLCTEAICTLANVVSPNCIWFKLKNSISSQLQCIKPCYLEKLELYCDSEEVIEKYSYVMAPWKENIYARARVLNTKRYKNEDYACVHFIDEGQANWVNVNCLATMESVFYTHPWQAISVALFKLFPGLDVINVQFLPNWSIRVTQLLERILKEYEFFRVVPIHDSRRHKTYDEYVRVILKISILIN